MAEMFGQKNGDLRISRGGGSGVSISLHMETSTKETQDLVQQLKAETHVRGSTPGETDDDEDSFECDIRTLKGSYAQSKRLSVNDVLHERHAK